MAFRHPLTSASSRTAPPRRAPSLPTLFPRQCTEYRSFPFLLRLAPHFATLIVSPATPDRLVTAPPRPAVVPSPTTRPHVPSPPTPRTIYSSPFAPPAVTTSSFPPLRLSRTALPCPIALPPAPTPTHPLTFPELPLALPLPPPASPTPSKFKLHSVCLVVRAKLFFLPREN